MRIFEVSLPNEVAAKLNKIKIDFDEKYNSLSGLMKYLKDNKTPFVYKEYLAEIQQLETRINKYLELGDLLDWNDPDITRFKYMAESLKNLLDDLQNQK